MKFISFFLIFLLERILCRPEFDYIPKDENGIGYFISCKEDNAGQYIREDVKVEDVLQQFKENKKFLK